MSTKSEEKLSAKPKTCVPCSSLDKSALLSREEVETALATSLPTWKISGNDVLSIARKFTAKNFQCALDAINSMGKIAEREGHHPDFHLTSYRDVEVVLFTHKVGGVTQNDIDMAIMFNKEVSVVYSPKWLKEHPEAAMVKQGE